MMQLSDEEVELIYRWETKGITAKEWIDHQGLNLLLQYQIKELYWEKEIMNETTKYRNALWTKLDQTEANYKYYNNKIRLKGQKEAIIKKLKPITAETEWDKVLKSLDKNKFPEYYMENHTFTLRWCSLCNEYRNLARRGKRCDVELRMDERLNIIKVNRWD
jgi:hypothetical protein